MPSQDPMDSTKWKPEPEPYAVPGGFDDLNWDTLKEPTVEHLLKQLYLVAYAIGWWRGHDTNWKKNMPLASSNYAKHRLPELMQALLEEYQRRRMALSEITTHASEALEAEHVSTWGEGGRLGDTLIGIRDQITDILKEGEQ